MHTSHCEDAYTKLQVHLLLSFFQGLPDSNGQLQTVNRTFPPPPTPCSLSQPALVFSMAMRGVVTCFTQTGACEKRVSISNERAHIHVYITHAALHSFLFPVIPLLHSLALFPSLSPSPSSLSQEQLSHLVKLMGSKVQKDYTRHVTHLIAGQVGSTKYNVSCDVMLLLSTFCNVLNKG